MNSDENAISNYRFIDLKGEIFLKKCSYDFGTTEYTDQNYYLFDSGEFGIFDIEVKIFEKYLKAPVGDPEWLIILGAATWEMFAFDSCVPMNKFLKEIGYKKEKANGRNEDRKDHF